jgi:Flp pilus assembly protein TadD
MMQKARWVFIAASLVVGLGAAEAQQPDSSRTRTLSGSVRMSAGQLPSQRVRLSLYTMSGTLADELFTDSSGNFEFTRVRAGVYRLDVQAPGCQLVSLEANVSPFTARTVLPPITLTPLSPEAGGAAPAGTVAASEFEVPKDARKAFEKGLQAAEDNRHSEARKHFARAIELHPDYFRAHYWLGVSLTFLGEFAEARKELERAAELDPRAPEPYLALGKALNLTNESQEAKAVLLKGTQLNPASAAMWVELSRAEFSLGELNDAVQHAAHALELDADAPTEAHLILANACLKLKRYPEAERELTAFLKRDPKSPSAPKAREVLDQLHRAGVRPPNE